MSEQYVIKTSDLETEFNIGKNTRCTRLAMIGLIPEVLHKEGKYYWLTEQQYQLFKDLDAYILETGSHRDFPGLVSIAPTPESAQLATIDRSSDLDAPAVTGQFEPVYPVAETPGSSLAQQINFNAQQRAAAIVMAEIQIADRYLQNPEALPIELRNQIDSIALRQIDPNALAASLFSGVKNLVGVTI